nr:WhiB family transcriptional regulator [Streptomyces atriruber]
MDSALCAQTGGDFFFPGTGESYAQARRICGACPVRTECGEYADEGEGTVAHPYRHGYWGGKTPRSRADRAA